MMTKLEFIAVARGPLLDMISSARGPAKYHVSYIYTVCSTAPEGGWATAYRDIEQ